MLEKIQSWISPLIVVPFFVYFVFHHNVQYPEHPKHFAAPYRQEYVPVPVNPTPVEKKHIDEASLNCLARNIYFEAANQIEKGKEAVAFVVVNRSRDPAFPSKVCEIVRQKTKSPDGKVVCQFSWVCEDKDHRIHNKVAWQSSFHVALNVLANYDKMKDPTHGAKYYHTIYIHPEQYDDGWAHKVKTVQIQDHVFFKDKKKG